MNLFAKAKSNVTSTKKSDSKKVEVQINDATFHADLTRLAEINRIMDELAAEQAMLHADIKSTAQDKFAELYKSKKENPGSFNIVAVAKNKPSASFMFIPTDNYIKIKDESRANYLRQNYSEDIVVEKNDYVFNNELLSKYQDEISNLISKSKKIEDGDKERLIDCVTTWSIKKGTVNEFLSNKDLKKFSLENLIHEIAPIFQVKNIKCDAQVIVPELKEEVKTTTRKVKSIA